MDLHVVRDEHLKVREIELLLQRITIIAPLTWGFGIVLGMLLAATGTIQPGEGEEYTSFLSNVAEGVVAGDLRRTLVAVALGMSISVVMLSTADSSLLAYMQATIQDVKNAKRGGSFLIVTYGVAAVLLILILAVLHKHYGQAHVFTIVGMFNAFVLLIAVPAILALKNRPMSAGGLWITLVIGLVLIILSTFGPVDSLPFNIKVVLPFFGALAGTLLGWALSETFR